jgi:hypothetical protein
MLTWSLSAMKYSSQTSDMGQTTVSYRYPYRRRARLLMPSTKKPFGSSAQALMAMKIKIHVRKFGCSNIG